MQFLFYKRVCISLECLLDCSVFAFLVSVVKSVAV